MWLPLTYNLFRTNQQSWIYFEKLGELKQKEVESDYRGPRLCQTSDRAKHKSQRTSRTSNDKRSNDVRDWLWTVIPWGTRFKQQLFMS